MPTTTTKSATRTKPAPAKDTPLCLCGCGDRTKGGRFIAGHDSILKSRLQKAFRADGLTAEQRRQVATLGWERYMTLGPNGATAANGDDKRPTKVPAGPSLPVPQVNILRALARTPAGLTRPEVTVEAGVYAGLTESLGPIFADDVGKVDARSGRRCLLGLKYVVCKKEDRDGKDAYVFFITALGRKALAKAEKETASLASA